jgi:hypothetical protein
MRWRQVLGLYVVAILLAAEYVRLGPPAPAPGPQDRPGRARVFESDPATLAEVRVERGDRRLVMRREGDGWMLVEPGEATVPRDLVTAFVNAVIDAEVIDRVERSGDAPEQFGLGEGASRIELWGVSPGAEVLLVGAPNPTGTAVYARRPGAPDVLLVGRTILYYEDLILQALPTPSVPADTDHGPVGSRRPLTSPGSPV